MFENLENLHFYNNFWQIFTPLIFSLFDILTGYIQARINNNVSSKIMREGLLHKFLLIIVIVISYILQISLQIKSLATIVCIYIVLMELTSICENLKKAGINTKLLSIFLGKEENKDEIK